MGSHPREFREGQKQFRAAYGAHGRTVTGLFEVRVFDDPMKQSRPNKLEPNLTGNESTRDLGSLVDGFQRVAAHRPYRVFPVHLRPPVCGLFENMVSEMPRATSTRLSLRPRTDRHRQTTGKQRQLL